MWGVEDPDGTGDSPDQSRNQLGAAMTTDSRGTPIQRFMDAASKIHPNELRATILSSLFIFVLMTAYFMLRPARDAMASSAPRMKARSLSSAGVSLQQRSVSQLRATRQPAAASCSRG